MFPDRTPHFVQFVFERTVSSEINKYSQMLLRMVLVAGLASVFVLSVAGLRQVRTKVTHNQIHRALQALTDGRRNLTLLRGMLNFPVYYDYNLYYFEYGNYRAGEFQIGPIRI